MNFTRNINKKPVEAYVDIYTGIIVMNLRWMHVGTAEEMLWMMPGNPLVIPEETHDRIVEILKDLDEILKNVIQNC